MGTVSNTDARSDFFVEVARGNVPGMKLIFVSALNEDVDMGTEQDMWGVGNTFIYPTAGEQWEVFSSSVNDTAAGTGARQIRLVYLDDAFIEQTEDITLNGTTPVSTIATDIFRPIVQSGGIFNRVISAGTLLKNDGEITIRVAGGGDPRGSISAGFNRALDSFYTVPLGKEAYLVSVDGGVEKGSDAILTFKATTGDDGIFLQAAPISIYQDNVVIDGLKPTGPIPEKSDIKWTATSVNNNTSVTMNYQLLVIDA